MVTDGIADGVADGVADGIADGIAELGVRWPPGGRGGAVDRAGAPVGP